MAIVTTTRIITFIWSFAEATFFFLVPDIWLSRIAIKNPKEAYINILFAICGALCGGVCIYLLGHYMFQDIEAIMTKIPAITEDMSAQVGQEMNGNNIFLPIVQAGVSGVPYKLYALWAGLLEIPLWLFLIVSAIARGSRFLIVIVLFHVISEGSKYFINTKKIIQLHFLFWIVFYTLFLLRKWA